MQVSMDEGIDSGHIILQRELEIRPSDTEIMLTTLIRWTGGRTLVRSNSTLARGVGPEHSPRPFGRD